MSSLYQPKAVAFVIVTALLAFLGQWPSVLEFGLAHALESTYEATIGKIFLLSPDIQFSSDRLGIGVDASGHLRGETSIFHTGTSKIAIRADYQGATTGKTRLRTAIVSDAGEVVRGGCDIVTASTAGSYPCALYIEGLPPAQYSAVVYADDVEKIRGHFEIEGPDQSSDTDTDTDTGTASHGDHETEDTGYPADDGPHGPDIVPTDTIDAPPAITAIIPPPAPPVVAIFNPAVGVVAVHGPRTEPDHRQYRSAPDRAGADLYHQYNRRVSGNPGYNNRVSSYRPRQAYPNNSGLQRGYASQSLMHQWTQTRRSLPVAQQQNAYTSRQQSYTPPPQFRAQQPARPSFVSQHAVFTPQPGRTNEIQQRERRRGTR